MKRKFAGIVLFVAVIALVAFQPFSRMLYAQNGHTVTLTWTAPATGGAPASYNVKRGTSAGSEATVASVPAPTTTYVDSTGTQGTQYFYVVTAVNSAGEGPSSNEVSATFLVDLPGAPSGLAAVAK